ncbi:MAG: DUF4114 domain-containing protein [Deltaproteobacteria bacterium]|nr:DUF4114 domain-containing protein [Deltaproteobacteria bacterium]
MSARSVRFLLVAWLAALVMLASPAHALKQPNNVEIPVGAGLQGLFDSRGEAINSLADAAATPETFTPTCQLEFEVLQRNAGYKNAFGWYNVTGSKPALADLHEFLSCNDPVGTKKVLNIKKDPAYLGGDIGFFEATGGCGSVQSHDAIFYSEKKYNPDSDQQNPFIHLLIYNSTVVQKGFYFGWEDLLSGGDNDFDDLTTFVSGISCTGGGSTCATGKLGVCADGSLQCQSGALACVPLTAPSTEVCDGLDNDCSGIVDEGNLCPDAQVCDKGACVPKCGGGEFTCPNGTVCNGKGLCVDPACLQVTCPENSKCDGGKCVGPCDGVVCPFGEVCLAGACFDPCSKFTCDADQVCVLGTCVERCECAGCKKGNSCQPDGKCLLDACVNQSCAAGTHCDDLGNCVDDCLGAVCPSGQKCEVGECVLDPNAGKGGAGGDDSSGPGELVGSTTSGAGENTGAGGAGGSGTGGGGFVPPESSACGCRVVGASRPMGDGAARLVVLGFVVAFARRRLERRGRAWW